MSYQNSLQLRAPRDEPDLLTAHSPSTGQPTEQSDSRQAELLPVSTTHKVLQEEYSSHLCILLPIFWNVVTNSLYLLSSNEQVEKMKTSMK